MMSAFDGHAQVVGLTGEVGRDVIVGVTLFEGRIPQVTPQHGEHPEPVCLGEGSRHFDDLAVGAFRTEVDGGAHADGPEVEGLGDLGETSPGRRCSGS